MEPVLKPRPKMLSLDDKTLLNVARANILSQITVRPNSQCDFISFRMDLDCFDTAYGVLGSHRLNLHNKAYSVL